MRFLHLVLLMLVLVTSACYAEGDKKDLPALKADGEITKEACPHQDMVGQKMKDIDLKKIKGVTRVLYPNSPATMDYRPDRLNIILEEGTDIILEVRCG